MRKYKTKDSPAMLEAMTVLAASPLVRAAMHQGLSFAIDTLKNEMDKLGFHEGNGQPPMRRVLASKPKVIKRGRRPLSTAEKLNLSKRQKARWRKAHRIFGPNAKMSDLKGINEQ